MREAIYILNNPQMHTINDILGVALFAPRDSQPLPEADGDALCNRNCGSTRS
jgi:hypothetical protein